MNSVNLSPDTLDLFDAAVRHVSANKFPTKQMLKLYGLYKQATVGKCTKKKPPLYKLAEVNKYEAWKRCENLTMEQAMNNYVDYLCQIDKKFDVDKVKLKSPEERQAVAELEGLPPSVPPAFHGKRYRSKRHFVKSRTRSKDFDHLQIQSGYDPINETYDDEARIQLHERLARFYREMDPSRLQAGIGEIVDFGLREGEAVMNQSLRQKYDTDLQEMEERDQLRFANLRSQMGQKKKKGSAAVFSDPQRTIGGGDSKLLRDKLEAFFYRHDPEKLERGLRTGFIELLRYAESRGVGELNRKLKQKYKKCLDDVVDYQSMDHPVTAGSSMFLRRRQGSKNSLAYMQSQGEGVSRSYRTERRNSKGSKASKGSKHDYNDMDESILQTTPKIEHRDPNNSKGSSNSNSVLTRSGFGADRIMMDTPNVLPTYVEKALDSFYARYEPERLRDGSVKKVYDWAKRNGLPRLNHELQKRYQQSLDDFVEDSDQLRDDLINFYKAIDPSKIKSGLNKILNWGIKNGRIALNRKLVRKYGVDMNNYDTSDLASPKQDDNESVEF